MIRACAHEYDLVFHVRFYLVSQRTAEFYDDGSFWYRLCRMNGLGCLASENFDAVNWMSMAFECEEHVRTCTHPACGSQRLAENRE